MLTGCQIGAQRKSVYGIGLNVDESFCSGSAQLQFDDVGAKRVDEKLNMISKLHSQKCASGSDLFAVNSGCKAFVLEFFHDTLGL